MYILVWCILLKASLLNGCLSLKTATAKFQIELPKTGTREIIGLIDEKKFFCAEGLSLEHNTIDYDYLEPLTMSTAHELHAQALEVQDIPLLVLTAIEQRTGRFFRMYDGYSFYHWTYVQNKNTEPRDPYSQQPLVYASFFAPLSKPSIYHFIGSPRTTDFFKHFPGVVNKENKYDERLFALVKCFELFPGYHTHAQRLLTQISRSHKIEKERTHCCGFWRPS